MDVVRLFNISIAGIWSVIGLSYITATPILPGNVHLISEVWDTLPGKVLSRMILPPFIYIWSVYCWTVCKEIERTRRSRLNSVIRYNTQMGMCGFIGCATISITDSTYIHTVAAFLFFVSQNIFIYHTTIQFYLQDRNKVKASISLMFNCMMSLFISLFTMLHNVKQYRLGVVYLEWGTVLLISGLNLNLKKELNNDYMYNTDLEDSLAIWGTTQL